MFKYFSRTGKLITVILACSGLFCFLFWFQVARQLAEDRNSTLEAAIQRNSNLAVSLEQYAIRTISNADAVLKLVKLEYEHKGDATDIHSLMHTGIIDTRYFNGLAIISNKGLLQKTNLHITSDTVPNLSDREHFTFHKTHKDQLYISKPIMSRTIGRAVIALSRRIDLPDGSFGGTVAVQIEPSMFMHFYAKANLNPNDLISLIAPDGITYARRTGQKESYGEDISKSPLFGHVARNPVDHYFAKDAIRGIPTYFSYRKLEDYPMIATVGSAEHDVLAGYYIRKRRELVFGGIITLLLVLFSFLISAVLIHRRRNSNKIKDSEIRYRSIFENSQDAIIVLMQGNKVEAMNPAAQALFRCEGGKPETFGALFRSMDPELQLSLEASAPGHSEKAEAQFTLTDGSVFTGEWVYSNFEDIRGRIRAIILIRDISERKKMEMRLLHEQNRYQRKLTKQVILAQEREREAIGYELHDNVNQILTTVKLYLEMGMTNPEMRDTLIPRSIHYIMNCISEIRNLSRELSAPTLGTQSLIDSVKTLVDVVNSSSGIAIQFNHEDFTVSLAKDQNLAIYRILQEQFNNIVKHSGATQVTLVLSQKAGVTELIISDNGKGFDVHEVSNGIGLNNILSRAKMFGGDMSVVSRKGQGCILHVKMPIMATGEEAPPLADRTEIY